MYIKKLVDNFEDLDLHKDINIKLNRINELIDIAFLGDSGIGKITRVYLLLYKLYGEEIYNISNISCFIKTKKGKISFNYYKSKYYIDFDLSKYKNQKSIINIFMKEYMCSINIYNLNKNIIILINIHLLDNTILNMLALIIEKYTKTTKFILIGEKIKNYKLKSLFCIIQFKSVEYKSLRKFIKKNNKKLTKKNIEIIIDKSKFFTNKYNLNNINKLIKMTMITNKFIDFSNNIEDIVDEILDIIHSPSFTFNKIIKIKEKLYKLFCYNYPILNIIKLIQQKIINKYSNITDKQFIIYEMIKNSSDISKKIIYTNKTIMYLELYIIKYIDLIN